MPTNAETYLLTQQLELNCENHEIFNNKWKFAIFHSLRVSNTEVNLTIEWTLHNEWNIQHHFRSAKQVVKRNKMELLHYTINRIDDVNAEIRATFINQNLNDGHPNEVTFLYNQRGFLNELWDRQYPPGRSILFNQEECEIIYNASLDELNDDKNEKPNALIPDPNPTHFKFHVLSGLLSAVQPLYNAMQEDSHKAYYETVIGAAIFYLPLDVKNHFSGFISINAIRSYLRCERIVRDHMIPRRLAARMLLTDQIPNGAGLMDAFNTVYAKFMYVSVYENILLVNYFNNYNNYDDALIALNIDKFPVNVEDKFNTNRELTGYLRYLMERVNEEQINIEEIDTDTATTHLNYFRNQ